MEVWKDYTIEDAVVIIGKAVKTIKPQTINSCWRKLCPEVPTSQDLGQNQSKKS